MSAVIEIRDEHPGDIDAIREVNRQAFGQEQEGQLVDALRARGATTLSLVAVAGAAVVGHILFSPLNVGAEVGAGLGPMSVLPAYQRQGIGSQLVSRGIERLRDAGCPFIVVIGHPAFYPRFGFQSARAHGLTCRWNVRDTVFMVNVLDPAIAPRLRGPAEYQHEFSAFD